MAETVNTKIRSSYLRHQIRVIRYAEGLTAEAVTLLKATEVPLHKTILYYASILEGKQLNSQVTKRKLKRLSKSVKSIRSPAWESVTGLLDTEISKLVISENKFVAGLIDELIPVSVPVVKPSNKTVRSLVTGTSFEGKTLSEWIKDESKNDHTAIIRAVKVGLGRRENAAQITKRVMGTKRLRRKNGSVRKSFKNIEALSLTVTNKAQSDTSSAFASENSWLIQNEYFTATLDARTSPNCMVLDGQVFPIGKGPHPPLHFRCRSIRLPYISPESIAERPTNPVTEKMLVKEYNKANNVQSSSRSNLPRGHKTKFDAFARVRKRELVGQIPEKTKYQDWLKTQSTDFQNEVLKSKVRGDLFRQNKITLDKFVNQQGNFLTHEELELKGYL